MRGFRFLRKRHLGRKKMIKSVLLLGAAVIGLAGFAAGPAAAQERTIKIAGFGAQSGAVRSFGVNAEAVMKAAADEINAKGGVKLKDGTMAKIVVAYNDDRCDGETGI